ncbi:MAG: SpoIID/LytB domain-containing protein [bacterium]
MKKAVLLFFLVFVLLVVFASGAYPASSEKHTIIRVGLIQNAASVKINGVNITRSSISGVSETFQGSWNNHVNVNGAPYRGLIEVRKNDSGRLTVINIIDIEHYLYGVVSKEISPNWPEEAVKAQIVAARTFALKNMGKHKSEGFDICDTVHCQVYGGVWAENSVSNKLVDETVGEVMTYMGELINASYHGICGGYTEDPRDVWEGGSRIPYLSSVKCNYCRDAKGFNWTKEIDISTLQSKLSAAGISVGKIQSMLVFRKSKTGRAKEIKISGSKTYNIIKGTKLRSLLGTNVIRSTMFNVNKKGKSFVFTGKGWGHGVGMCQEGARGMAEKGNTYKQILKFYYRGVMIKQ